MFTGKAGGDPRSASLVSVADGLVKIIEVEGPVMAKRVYEIYLRGFGIERIDHEMKSTFNKALAIAIRQERIVYVNEDGGSGYLYSIVRIKGSKSVRLRERGPRSFAEIPPSELRATAQKIADRSGLVSGCEEHRHAILMHYELEMMTVPIQAVLDKVVVPITKIIVDRFVE